MASLKNKDRLLDSLKREIVLQKDYLAKEELTSIYFGGGTPSMLEPIEIAAILTVIRQNFKVSNSAEITIETNPDDIVFTNPPLNRSFESQILTAKAQRRKEYNVDFSDLASSRLRGKKESAVETANVNSALFFEYHALGINRLSIGIQSFFDDDLEYLNRIHNSDQAINTVITAQKAGFKNISIDLIYAIPTLTNEKWRKNIEMAFSLDVQHISAYSLTVEPKTALDVLIRKKQLPAPLEESAVEQFKILMEEMKNHGYLHYEISNFCKEGYYSQHNSSYWKGESYLGIGPSAHSYNGVSRQWNISGIVEYIEKVNAGRGFFEVEWLTTEQKHNEYIMTSLRTMWGCDMAKIKTDFGEDFASRVSCLASRFLKDGLIEIKGEVIFLTDEGKLFADGIAAEFFLD